MTLADAALGDPYAERIVKISTRFLFRRLRVLREIRQTIQKTALTRRHEIPVAAYVASIKL